MWQVTLKSGAKIELWADGYSTEPIDEHWVFDVLVDATREEQREVRVASQTIPPSQRCSVVVARIPVDEVTAIVGGWPLSVDPDAP